MCILRGDGIWYNVDMKNKILAVAVLSFCVWSVACGVSPVDLLIPKPVRVSETGGTANVASLERISVVRQAVPGAPSTVAAEAYVLEIGTDGVKITASDARGERYARVTLAQLVKLSDGKVPCCRITDWPVLRWRGFMNDCGRNYLEMSGVRAIIDMMAAYKLNLFHWHLSDYHGWRLESKKYPQLNAKGAFMRQIGKYYTQEEFKEMVKYAGERGITIMPELDVPGHTLAFRRGMGISTMKAPGTDRVVSELFEELCSLASKEEMPFVHLGTDEVRMSAEYCDDTWPTKWARTLNAAGRKAVVWAPGKLIDPSCKTVDMVWHDNHVTNTVNESFDSARLYNTSWTPFEVLRHAAFKKPCRWDIAEERKLGAITCTWHDDNVGDDTLKLFKECMVFPSIVAMGDNFWHGRAKDEPAFIGRMPKPGTEPFARVCDLERRMLAHRDVVLAEFPHPFPFMSQTEMRWRVVDCSTGAVLADEIAQGTIRMNDPYEALLLPKDAPIFASMNGRVAIETWIHAPSDIDCGGWIDLSGINGVYGRLRMPNTPKAGEWNSFNGKISLNGVDLPPPAWKQPGMNSTAYSGPEQDVPYSNDMLEKPLVDEMPALREPYPIHLKKGWNHVRIETDVAKAKTWYSCAVTFAVFNGAITHPRTVPGLTYSAKPPAER